MYLNVFECIQDVFEKTENTFKIHEAVRIHVFWKLCIEMYSYVFSQNVKYIRIHLEYKYVEYNVFFQHSNTQRIHVFVSLEQNVPVQ